MPPHSPSAASPIPIQRGSKNAKRTVGPEGQAFAKWKPWTLGRKPGTVRSFIGASLAAGRARRLVGDGDADNAGWDTGCGEGSGSRVDDVEDQEVLAGARRGAHPEVDVDRATGRETGRQDRHGDRATGGGRGSGTAKVDPAGNERGANRGFGLGADGMHGGRVAPRGATEVRHPDREMERAAGRRRRG